MLTCIRMHYLIKIYHVIQELLALIFTKTDSHRDYSAPKESCNFHLVT